MSPKNISTQPTSSRREAQFTDRYGNANQPCGIPCPPAVADEKEPWQGRGETGSFTRCWWDRGTVWQVLKKLARVVTWPRDSSPGLHPKPLKRVTGTKTCTRTFTAPQFTTARVSMD